MSKFVIHGANPITGSIKRDGGFVKTGYFKPLFTLRDIASVEKIEQMAGANRLGQGVGFAIGGMLVGGPLLAMLAGVKGGIGNGTDVLARIVLRDGTEYAITVYGHDFIRMHTATFENDHTAVTVARKWWGRWWGMLLVFFVVGCLLVAMGLPDWSVFIAFIAAILTRRFSK